MVDSPAAKPDKPLKMNMCLSSRLRRDEFESRPDRQRGSKNASLFLCPVLSTYYIPNPVIFTTKGLLKILINVFGNII